MAAEGDGNDGGVKQQQQQQEQEQQEPSSSQQQHQAPENGGGAETSKPTPTPTPPGEGKPTSSTCPPTTTKEQQEEEENEVDGKESPQAPPPAPAAEDETNRDAAALTSSQQPPPSSPSQQQKDQTLLLKERLKEDGILQKAAVARAVARARSFLSSLSTKEQKDQKKNRTHWDYVMEEMQWLAYDLGQERRYKQSLGRSVSIAAAREARSKERAKEKKKETTGRRSTRSSLPAAKTTTTAPSPPSSPISPLILDDAMDALLGDKTQMSSLYHYDISPSLQDSIDLFYESMQAEEAASLQSYHSDLLVFEKKLEEHRKLQSLAEIQKSKQLRRQMMHRVKDKLNKTRQAMAAIQTNKIYRDANGNIVVEETTTTKKGKKRKNKRMLESIMNDGIFGEEEKKKGKKSKKGRLLEEGDNNPNLGDNPLERDPKKKKKKGKKGKKELSLDPQGLDPLNLLGGDLPARKVSTKKGKKGKSQISKKGKKGKSQSKSSFGLDPSGFSVMQPFGEPKMDIAQMLTSNALAKKLSSLIPKSSKSKNLKQDLAALLKVQTKEGKKKSGKSQSKKGQRGSQGDAASLYDSEPPWTIAEDQVLLAVVYEFGSNWGVVADVLSCTYVLRDVFRRPHACRQRFKWICSSSSAQAGKKLAQAANQAAAAKATMEEKKIKEEEKKEEGGDKKEEGGDKKEGGGEKDQQQPPAAAATGTQPPAATTTTQPPAATTTATAATTATTVATTTQPPPATTTTTPPVPVPPPVVPAPTYAVALKVNRSNAKMLLHHVTPADEDTLKKHLDVIISVSSKHRMNRQHIEQQKSSKDMQLVEMHPSHKNAQALASRGQMLMNPGALCEYVNSTTYNSLHMKGGDMGSPGPGAPGQPGPPGPPPVSGRGYPPSEHSLAGPPRGYGQDPSQSLQMVASPRMQQTTQAMGPMSMAMGGTQGGPLLSPRGGGAGGSKGSMGKSASASQMLPLHGGRSAGSMQEMGQMQQRYMMAYHHQQQSPHSMPAPGMNMSHPYSQSLQQQVMPPSAVPPPGKQSGSGKGKGKKGPGKKQQQGAGMGIPPSTMPIMGYPPGGMMERAPMDLDGHSGVPLSSGMHSLMQPPPGPYNNRYL